MAARELLRRQDASESLIAFTEYTFENYHTSKHHRQIAEQLERVERGEIDRLMLLVPPRHGKSELASKRFPAFYLGRQPSKQFVTASATAELASDFGRDVRNIVMSSEYRAVFETRLAEDSSAKGKWHTSDGGVYYSVGIGGAIMGRGADVFLIDDPYTSMEDALSELARKRVLDWYRGTVYNRLMPGGAIVLINHRMHEDDLSGVLLAQQAAGGDKWEVVELKALSDNGDALWPEAYPSPVLERIRANTLPRNWSALYQQSPTPDEGTFFQRGWFQRFNPEQKPAKLRLYGSSDYAVTEDGGDYTVHRIWGVDPMGDLWLLDGWRGQSTADVWIERQIDLVAQYKPLAWFGEAGVIIKAVEPMLRRRMNERKTWCRLEWLASIHDKPTRARGFQARAAMKKVHLPEDRDGDLVLEEYLRFPAGKHDDEVDCVATGTLITLADGSRVPIETLKIGQRVKTPEGSCPIADFRLTIRNAKVMRLELDTGETLIATPNHPIATDTGFVPIDMLSVGGRVMTERTQCQSKSFSMGEHIAAIPKASIYTTETTSKPEAARDSCIGMYGKQRMGQSQKVWSFITSMAIRQTIALKTFLASAPKTIALSILWVQKDTKNRSPIWSVSGTWLRLGTQLLTGWHSTLRTGSGPIATGLNARQFAYVAAQSSPQNIAGLRSIALMRVAKGTIFAAPMLTMYRQLRHMLYAPFAAITSKRRIPSPKDSAPQSVSRIIGISVLETREDVYNLTVEGEHVFYANGVLTHNCASLIGRALDQTHPAIAAPDTTPKPLLGMEALTMDKMWKDGRAKKQGGRI